MNTKLWMVTDGDYSAYHVCGIFSTKDRAEYAKRAFMAENDIEEIMLDEMPEHPKGYLQYLVFMERDGTVQEITQLPIGEITFSPWYGDVDFEYKKYHKTAAILGPGIIKNMRWEVMAEDEKHAIKIVNEKRLMMLANNEWPETVEEWRKTHPNP